MCHAFKASNLDPGGFAEYVRVPAPNVRHALFRVPRHVTDEAASFVEPLACCLRSVRRARVAPGDTVVVVGLGSIGCLFVQLLRRAGAVVVGCDPIAARAELARRLGAAAAGPASAAAAAQRELSGGRGAAQVIVTGGGTDVLPWAVESLRDGGTGPLLPRRGGAVAGGCDPIAARAELARRLGAAAAGPASAAAGAQRELSGGRGADQVIVTGGGTDVLPWAVESLRDGGTVHYFASGGDTLPLRLETLYHRELTLTATYSSSPSDLAEAFRLIVAGEVSVDRLVTHRVTLPGLHRGVDLMRRREALKVYVTP